MIRFPLTSQGMRNPFKSTALLGIFRWGFPLTTGTRNFGPVVTGPMTTLSDVVTQLDEKRLPFEWRFGTGLQSLTSFVSPSISRPNPLAASDLGR
jgi:hypothetical protein